MRMLMLLTSHACSATEVNTWAVELRFGGYSPKFRWRSK
jgi:hypothetical protein